MGSNTHIFSTVYASLDFISPWKFNEYILISLTEMNRHEDFGSKERK